MKKVCCIVLALALCMALGACGKNRKELAVSDLSMTVNGRTITAQSEVPDVLAIFDGAYETAEAVSCVYSGMERTYSGNGLIVYTYPGDDGQEHLMEAYADADAQTSRGVKIGSSLKDAEAAYGSDYTRAGNVVTFEIPTDNENSVPAGLYFELDDDIVTAIGIVAEHRAQ